MERQNPHITATYAEHIAVELGQIPEQNAPDEWATPDGVSGTTMSVSTISDGERLDPPEVQVHVYSGMKFYDEQDDRILTFRKATWFAFRSDETLDYSTPDDPVEVQFEEDENPHDPEGSPSLSLSGNEFARRIASGRYRNVTAEEEERERGEQLAAESERARELERENEVDL